jgi:hypothetical protein
VTAGYGLDCQGLISGRNGLSSFDTESGPALRCTQPPVHWALLPAVKCEVDHSPLSGA